MSRNLRRTAFVAAAGLLATACSPLLLFNAAVPKDSGGRRLAEAVSYGPDARQRLDVYAPARAVQEHPAPVIIFFYGGSWNSGTRSGYGFVGRALAARGFVTVIPDYRLVPQVRFPGFLEDGAAAVRWVRTHIRPLGGDPDRLILAGHSAGAYNAAMLALDARWLGADRKAVRGWMGLAGPYDFLPFDIPVTQAAFAGVNDAAATQPINHVRPDSPPALLATGDADTLVLPRNSHSLAERMETAGVPVIQRHYAGVGHIGILTALARPFRGRAPVLDDMVTFATTYTAPKP